MQNLQMKKPTSYILVAVAIYIKESVLPPIKFWKWHKWIPIHEKGCKLHMWLLTKSPLGTASCFIYYLSGT